MSTKTVQKTMPKAASKPLLVEKTTTIDGVEIDRSVGMIGEFVVIEIALYKNGFMEVRRNRDIFAPKFVKDEYRVLYYAIIFLFPEMFGTGRYGSTTCTALQTKARQRLFAGINAESFTMERAIKWLQKAMLKAAK